MPKIDPITGCHVMTQNEFWQSEAKDEGKTAAEVHDEFYDDMEKERIKEEERLKDKKVALDYFKNARYFDEEDLENSDPEIEKVLDIHEVHYSFNFKETLKSIYARLLLKNKKEVNATYRSFHTRGSMMEPPDDEELIEWEKVPDTSKRKKEK